jgi:hypothetical protein
VLLLFPLVILLFPDGRLTRPWTWVLRSYLVLVIVLIVGIFANEAGAIVGRPIQVDLSGAYSGRGSPGGVLGALAAVAGGGFIIAPLFWPAFVGHQVLSWRRSASERRQQLKWLMCGAAIALAGLALIVLGPPKDQTPGRVARDLAFLAVGAVPASMGVGILKYHPYDIDRLISRTLSYTLVTGVLVGACSRGSGISAGYSCGTTRRPMNRRFVRRVRRATPDSPGAHRVNRSATDLADHAPGERRGLRRQRRRPPQRDITGYPGFCRPHEASQLHMSTGIYCGQGSGPRI